MASLPSPLLHKVKKKGGSLSLRATFLAFSPLPAKRSEHFCADNDSIDCLRANVDDRVLQPTDNTGPLHGIFVEDGKPKKPQKEEEAKVKTIQQMLGHQNITSYKDSDVSYILSTDYVKGDVEAAFELLLTLEDSEQGNIVPYKLDVKLLGAINREGVTCYLDALLFAMFARMGSFEAMLFKNFDDQSRKKLATLLRLWVNILRSGKLVTVDITKQIQLQLSNCGWTEAANVYQQDTSEAFTFITGKLGLPLLTLKMDIFHTGKEDTKDDHKVINERLLELAVPEEPQDEQIITLEDCLELYFNNQIVVKRYLNSLERRNTMSSMLSRISVSSTKAQTSHIEVAEIADSTPSLPMLLQVEPDPLSTLPRQPTLQRIRAPSIIQEREIDEKLGLLDGPEDSSTARTRREVVMPAWQFFSLIPWYTDLEPTNNAEIAAHFSSSRPILGICLKRYGISSNGTAFKRKTYIDIPLEIALPHFISDDTKSDDGPAFRNFKLSLQSVVSHRGISLDSGHYISAVRSPNPSYHDKDQWLRFDDLAKERVIVVSIEEWLKKEYPYLLFYQVKPIDGDENSNPTEDLSLDKDEPPGCTTSVTSISSKPDVSSGGDGSTVFSGSEEGAVDRPSSNTSVSDDGKRGRSSMTNESRKNAVVASRGNTPSSKPRLAVDESYVGEKAKLLIPELRPDSRISIDDPHTLTASRRGSKRTKASSWSRPNSQSGEARLSTSISRLTNRMSGDKPNSLPAQVKVADVDTAPRTSGTYEDEQNVVVTKLQETKYKQKKETRERHLLTKGNKPDRECNMM